jgi:polyphosphate kinase
VRHRIRCSRAQVPGVNIRQYVPLPIARAAGASPVRDAPGHHRGTTWKDLFPGLNILEIANFRVTRSAGIQKDDLDTANLLQSIEADLKQPRFARVVRVEIEPGASPTSAAGCWTS